MNKGPIPIVVAAVKDKRGRILIAKRRDREFKKADGLWELPGGHLRFKEKPEKAAIREVYEETGLKVKVLRLLPKIYNNFWQDRKGNQFHILLILYECMVAGGRIHKKPQDYKICELKWIWPKEITKYKFLPKTIETLALLNLN